MYSQHSSKYPFFIKNIFDGTSWKELPVMTHETFHYGALIVVSLIGAIRFIAQRGIQTYRHLKKEIKNEHDRNY